MVGKLVQGRTAVFMDAANIFYSQKTLGWKVDYKRLAHYLGSETMLVALYFYTGKIGSSEKQTTFLHTLREIGYTVTEKEVKFIKVNGSPDILKGNLDVELALDAFRLRKGFDSFILFSGDSDFAYLLDLLKQDGKRVIVVSMRGHVSRELLTRAKYVALPKLRDYIQKIKEPDKPAPEV